MQKPFIILFIKNPDLQKAQTFLIEIIMESISKLKWNFEMVSYLAFAILAAGIIGSMLYQCSLLYTDFHDQPVTTNIYVDDVRQTAFFSTLQFCTTREHLMNLTRAELFGLNESHRNYLLNYFTLFLNVAYDMTSLEKLNAANQTSLEAYIEALFHEWNRIEEEVTRIAETALSSSNPMEFWNYNQLNKLLAVKYTGQNRNTSDVVGPYTTPPNKRICYDIPLFPANNDNDTVEFFVRFSINRTAALGSSLAYVSPYHGNLRVFDDGYSAIDYAKDPAKQMAYLDLENIVSIKKWVTLDRRKRHCIKDEVR